MTTEEKLIHFQENAMETARSQSSGELDAYTESLNTLFKEHCDYAKKQAEMHLQTAKEALYRERNKKMSKAQMDIRRRLIIARTGIEDQLFAEVTSLLQAYRQTPDYLLLLKRQIRDAKQIAGQDRVQIYLDASDADKKDSLEKETGVEISISENNLIGGVRAVIPARNILIDESFACRMKEEREHIQLGGEAYV